MNFFNKWQIDYRRDRYLEFIEEKDLQQRMKDILNNTLIITGDGKVALRRPDIQEGHYWLRLWTEVLEEFKIRFGPYPNGFKNLTIAKNEIPHPENPIIEKAINALKAIDSKPGSYFVKYGKLIYLEPFLKKGILRLCSAGSYNDPSLNQAIQDNELSCSIHLHPAKLKMEAFDQKTGQSKGQITPLSNITMIMDSPTNYYVYCLSSIYLPRLFADFEADSCILINNPPEFFNRLTSTLKKQQFKGWDAFLKKVSYFDPFKPAKQDFDGFSCKHFRYSYQREWRYLWLPPQTMQELNNIDIELGSLEDICKMVVP